jgi:PAS domain S-box-containing protein
MSENFTKKELEQKIKVLEDENNTLRKDNEKYLNIINSMSEGYAETDLEGNFTFINDVVPKFHRRTRDEMIGMSLREFLTPEEKKRRSKRPFWKERRLIEMS